MIELTIDKHQLNEVPDKATLFELKRTKQKECGLIKNIKLLRGRDLDTLSFDIKAKGSINRKLRSSDLKANYELEIVNGKLDSVKVGFVIRY